MDQFVSPQQQPFPPSASMPSAGSLTNMPNGMMTGSPPQAPSTPSPSMGGDDQIPQMLQMNLQITMIALLKLLQSQLTAQTNSYEKTKNVPPISQAITALHTAFHNTESLNFEKTKPDNSEVKAMIDKQNADHQFALDLMNQQHEEKMAEHKASLDEQQVQHKLRLEEMKLQIEQQKAEQQMQHTQELHESQKEQNQINKAQTLQQAQHTEEIHQQTMSNQQETHEKELKEPSDKGSTSKPE